MARLRKRQVGFTDDEWEALYDEGRVQGGRANGPMVRESVRAYLRYMQARRDGVSEPDALRIVAAMWRRNNH